MPPNTHFIVHYQMPKFAEQNRKNGEIKEKAIKLSLENVADTFQNTAKGRNRKLREVERYFLIYFTKHVSPISSLNRFPGSNPVKAT